MSGRAVLLWVVLPFVALSALALWLTREPPSERPVAPRPSPPPVEPAPVERVPPPPAPSPRAAPPAAEEEPLPDLPPGTWTREEVRAALRAVQPLMRECLQDAEGRHVGAQSARLRFTLESREGQGHFLRGEVVESSLQDPFVFACLLDTLADAQFSAAPGRPPLTLTYPFHSRSP